MDTGEFNAGVQPCDGLASYLGGSRNTSSLFMLLLPLELNALRHKSIQIMTAHCGLLNGQGCSVQRFYQGGVNFGPYLTNTNKPLVVYLYLQLEMDVVYPKHVLQT